MLFKETAAFTFTDAYMRSNIIQGDACVIVTMYVGKHIAQTLHVVRGFGIADWLSGKIIIQMVPDMQKLFVNSNFKVVWLF